VWGVGVGVVVVVLGYCCGVDCWGMVIDWVGGYGVVHFD
jgi:hypothetical protein